MALGVAGYGGIGVWVKTMATIGFLISLAALFQLYQNPMLQIYLSEWTLC